jgi:hypothetical protein
MSGGHEAKSARTSGATVKNTTAATAVHMSHDRALV